MLFLVYILYSKRNSRGVSSGRGQVWPNLQENETLRRKTYLSICLTILLDVEEGNEFAGPSPESELVLYLKLDPRGEPAADVSCPAIH
jgi:hypothetical protein